MLYFFFEVVFTSYFYVFFNLLSYELNRRERKTDGIEIGMLTKIVREICTNYRAAGGEEGVGAKEVVFGSSHSSALSRLLVCRYVYNCTAS